MISMSSLWTWLPMRSPLSFHLSSQVHSARKNGFFISDRQTKADLGQGRWAAHGKPGPWRWHTHILPTLLYLLPCTLPCYHVSYYVHYHDIFTLLLPGAHGSTFLGRLLTNQLIFCPLCYIYYHVTMSVTMHVTINLPVTRFTWEHTPRLSTLRPSSYPAHFAISVTMCITMLPCLLYVPVTICRLLCQYPYLPVARCTWEHIPRLTTLRPSSCPAQSAIYATMMSPGCSYISILPILTLMNKSIKCVSDAKRSLMFWVVVKPKEGWVRPVQIFRHTLSPGTCLKSSGLVRTNSPQVRLLSPPPKNWKFMLHFDY